MNSQFLPILSVAALVCLLSCSKTKTENRKAEEPSEVAGGFGLTMQCSVLNGDDVEATSSSVGCLVFNDDGSRYEGPISESSAEIVTASGQVIKVPGIANGADAGSYSFGTEVSGLKPADAATIRVTAKFAEGKRTLVASLKGRLTTTCDRDLSFFVRHESENPAYKNNVLCTKVAPCSTIAKAIRLLPDILSCTVTIDVGAGHYKENILIDSIQVSQQGKLVIAGEEVQANQPKKTIISQDRDKADAVVRVIGVRVSSAKTTRSVVFKDLLTSCPENPGTQNDMIGFHGITSNIEFDSVEISNCDSGIFASEGSSISINTLTVRGFTKRGAHFTDTEVLASGSIKFENTSPDVSVRIGFSLSDSSFMSAASLGDGFYDLEISGTLRGGFLSNSSSMRVASGDKISISNSQTGFELANSSELTFMRRGKNRLHTNLSYFNSEPARISITASKTAIVASRESRVVDDNIWSNRDDLNNPDFYPTRKPIINIAIIPQPVVSPNAPLPPPSYLFNLMESELFLRWSELTFCTAGTDVFRSVADSRMVLSWNKNPFIKNCYAPNEPGVDTGMKNIFLYDYFFVQQPEVTKDTSCPQNYLSADGMCYGRFGYFEQHPYERADLTAYLGPFGQASQVDVLPYHTPAVDSVTPPTTIQAGASITIKGSSFMNDATVTVGGSPCQDIKPISSTTITCKLPSLTGLPRARAIQVTNPGNSKVSNPNITITY